MSRHVPSRKALDTVTTSLLVLAVTAAVFVAGPASASTAAKTPKKKPAKTTTTKTTTTKTTTTKTTPASTTSTTPLSPLGPNADSPGAEFFVLNGTANAASDHEIVTSSAFPNYTSGAVDNYYAMAHTHVDNSPFAEGTSSPADTGPVGQTAAAGNFQQPQYADARWPGDPGKASYGNQGGPYAASTAGEYAATADAAEASNGLNGPSAPIAAPKGFDGRLREALAAWKAKWQQHRPSPAKPLSTPTLTTPPATVPSPVATVTTPAVTVAGLQTPPPPAPPVTVPLPGVTTTAMRGTAPPARSLASASSPSSSSSSSLASGDGMSALESSAKTVLDAKTKALVTSGESRVGRVSLGGGQIQIEGIHVTASITNDGTNPTDKVTVSIAGASIGGVPVTIDQDGVHVAGQGQGIPYKQVGDTLNTALKNAGIQIFLVGPEITTTAACDQSGSGSGYGSGSGGGSTTTSSSTTSTSTDQSGTGPSSDSCGQMGSCDQGGTGAGSTTTSATPVPAVPSGQQTGTTSTTSTTSSCGTGACDQSYATGDTTTSRTTTTTSSTQSSPGSTTSSCDQSGFGTTPTSSCTTGGTGTTTTGSNDQSATTGTTDTTSTSGFGDFGSPGSGSSGSGEETLVATGLHIVFTQPVGQSGVPTQNAEHILGEVYLDSLAQPAGPVPKLDLNFGGFGSSGSTFGASSGSGSSSCLGGHFHRTKSGGTFAGGGGGGSLAGGSGVAGAASGYTGGSVGSQPMASTAGSPLVSSLRGLASLLRKKPLWVVVAYLVWQALAVGTAASLRLWQRGGAA